jgi:hypothetical protein
MEADRILDETGEAFPIRHNRESFQFGHHLDPARFALPELVALAQRRPEHPVFAYWSNGAVDPSARWEAGGHRLSLTETVAGIARNDSLVLLKRVEQDPAFRPLMTAVLSEVVSACGPQLGDDVLIGRATILLGSPGRITAYHMDADCNYLFQVTGPKTIRVFEPIDRLAGTQQVLERFFGGDLNSARFEEARHETARSYALDRGVGVHIPCLAPHWAEVGPEVSVAVSINFDLRSATRTGRLHRVNDQLRRCGLEPTPPGLSPWRDGMKIGLATGALAARRLVKRPPDPFPETAWRP